MDVLIVAYSYNRMLYSNKNEETTAVYNNMNEAHTHNNQQKKVM